VRAPELSLPSAPLEKLPPIAVRFAPRRGLDLDPARVFALAIRLIGELGDDPLEALLLSGSPKLHRIVEVL